MEDGKLIARRLEQEIAPSLIQLTESTEPSQQQEQQQDSYPPCKKHVDF